MTREWESDYTASRTCDLRMDLTTVANKKEMCDKTAQSSMSRKTAGGQSSTAQPSPGSFLEHSQHNTTKTSDDSVQILSRDEENSRLPQRRMPIQKSKRADTIRDASPHSFAQLQTSSSTMHIPLCMIREDPKILTLLQQSSESPPCTIDTLRELDVTSIQSNLNLRIDICYDQDLYFQPISGQKGDAKRLEGKKYWLSLAAEFRIYGHDAQSGCEACCKRASFSHELFQPRLPILFSNLKEIVQMLVPESEHKEIAEQLDIDLLMQQVRRGSFDVLRLTKWLTSLLMLHCAPMRDHIAGEVTELIQDSVSKADMHILVSGIEKLFGLLEAMKLDIANHQIRTCRYTLITETISFQRQCFTKAIEDNQMTIESSQNWFLEGHMAHTRSCATFGQRKYRPKLIHGFLHAMVRLCNPSVKKVPTTFQYDHNRFVRLQEDLQDLIHIKLCFEVFRRRVLELTKEVRDCSTVFETLKPRIIFLTEDEEGNGGSIADHLDSIGIELTRAAIDLIPSRLAGCIEVTDEECQRTQDLLHGVFQYEDIHQQVTENFLSNLETRTIHHAKGFEGKSPLEISNAQRSWGQIRAAAKSNKTLLLSDCDDMARRLAHIGVLHWRVWASMCYLKEPINLSYLVDPSSLYSIPSDSQSALGNATYSVADRGCTYDDIVSQFLTQNRDSTSDVLRHQRSGIEWMPAKEISDIRVLSLSHGSNAENYQEIEIDSKEDVQQAESDMEKERRSLE